MLENDERLINENNNNENISNEIKHIELMKRLERIYYFTEVIIDQIEKEKVKRFSYERIKR